MTVAALSSTQLTQLESHLKQLAPAGAEAQAIAPGAIGTVESDFCSLWPKARPILALVAKYIGFIPGVGSTAGVILNGLLTAGDAVSGVICPKT